MSTVFFEQLKKKIKDYAYLIGIDKIGFADAKPLEGHLDRLMLRQSGNYSYALNEGNPLRRINPAISLPGAKSVICAAVAYEGCDNGLPETCSPEPGVRGRLSFIARGRDYHAVMYERLEKLKSYILETIPQAEIAIMVDKDEILEKAYAAEAGLGWFGKNTLLVTPEFGSLVYLGELVCDIPFSPDSPIDEGCGQCQNCLEACPTGAVDIDKNLNPDRCLAGVSQYKGVISHELRQAMGNTIYGCDICQIACPYNKKAISKRNRKGFDCDPNSAGHNDAFPLLSDLFKMTNSEFKNRFGHTAGAWRGKTVFQRNAVIAAGNAGDPSFVPELIRLLREDSRPVIRGAAAWSLSRIGNEEALEALKEALFVEKDLQITNEIKEFLRENNKS